MPTDPCSAIASELGALFSCQKVGAYTRIRTPFMYPDGDLIDVFFDDSHDPVSVSDLGETSRWLRMQTASDGKLTARQRRLIEDVCQTQGGVEFYSGTLFTRVRKDKETLSEAITRLVGSCIRVADVWFTMRTRAVETVTDEVADFLAEKQIDFQRAAKHVGRSGRVYTVDFHTRTPARSSLVYVLSTGNRASARPVVNSVVTAWHDLSHLVSDDYRFVSLFDDTLDVWSPEDFSLVESLSDLARWSRPDNFEELLRAS